ncbi:tRNA uridine-5-carboxymethylaminomethyl(34) synthesis GTPase MnmE [Parerythrobacter jejuensis]|uniref:tRNA modification GTPase MnmE n=1 Tax=Parerythrobacter jejuensis TaxID=795812 RepID=A0A845APY9_9SPHN|nr:tRNA uridine-5-carboxymethylaminomethyl(34) synthesis GTPase MnmE [Parerythrobacter jejuensis]MXP30941.1 tRNA uridine-5-carboxymethylaminomethyl(34) synthesis GTPase MnmE [Parerythrobacter jejuensis]MXP33701.1 tRNA uridine-5-carboxymethylaminomethyl(34) synthesis GTPase MnmE [Parerythrobacter jejuensis]
MDTIFALSSGAPPAAIGVMRISGPLAKHALESLGGGAPDPRRASLRTLRNSNGDVLDTALVLWLPGPDNATGEDSTELHCHGGRAVIGAIEASLLEIDGLRKAEPGEFTRRAFANGRMDLAQAEGLADLLFAETELQRQVLQVSAGGGLSKTIGEWREQVLGLSAQVESALDFSDEDDVDQLAPPFFAHASRLAGELAAWLNRPRVERLRDGIRVVLAGPPNAGKSTLFNALLESEAAIVSEIAGTTRDVIERPVSFEGIPFVLTDTAGLHEGSEDAIERVGIERAREALEKADIVLWLGPEGEGPPGAWEIEARIDRVEHFVKASPRMRLSAATGEGLGVLIGGLTQVARDLLPRPGESAVNQRQHALLAEAQGAIDMITPETDLLVVGEHLRTARSAFDRFSGQTGTEDMLDALFGQFCIGK